MISRGGFPPAGSMALEGDAVKDSGVLLAPKDWEAVQNLHLAAEQVGARLNPLYGGKSDIAEQHKQSGKVFHKSGWINFWDFVGLLLFFT